MTRTLGAKTLTPEERAIREARKEADRWNAAIEIAKGLRNKRGRPPGAKNLTPEERAIKAARREAAIEAAKNGIRRGRPFAGYGPTPEELAARKAEYSKALGIKAWIKAKRKIREGKRLDDLDALMNEYPDAKRLPSVVVRDMENYRPAIKAAERKQINGNMKELRGSVIPPKKDRTQARKLLADNFMSDLFEDWKANGAETLLLVRQQRPHEYLKIIASLMPRDITVTAAPLADISDEDLGRLISEVKTLSAFSVAPDLGSTAKLVGTGKGED